MAYITQEQKAKIAPVVKDILKKYGLKGSLSVQHHSTLNLTIKSGSIDFIGNFNEMNSNQPEHRRGHDAKGNIDVNQYWFQEHFSGKAAEVIAELIPALKGEGWYDNSDVQSDYFEVKHYIGIKVGRWDTAYIYEG